MTIAPPDVELYHIPSLGLWQAVHMPTNTMATGMTAEAALGKLSRRLGKKGIALDPRAQMYGR